MAEAAVEAGADAEGAGLLDAPVVAGEGRVDRLLPAVGVEGPGVGGVAAEVQAEAVDHLGAAELDGAEAAAAERDGDEAVRERVGGSRRCRPRAAGRGPAWTWNWRLPAAGSSASKRMRGNELVRVGLDSWNGTGAPVSSLIQRAPQSSKSR